MHYEVPASITSAWFDDVELRTTGSRQRLQETTIEATIAHAKRLAERGLTLAGNPVVASSNINVTHGICKRARLQGVKVQAASIG